MEAIEVLKKYWDHNSFRALQAEIIQSVLDKKDTLAILPTGGGKSICFQVPAMLMDGLCVVISPLIALMKDQVQQLKEKGIPAAALHSGLHYHEIDSILNLAMQDSFKFLYVSPERLKTEIFLARFERLKICMIAVDEAHCISQWGYDFRPAYFEIAAFKRLLHEKITILALTASATTLVKHEIVERLELKKGFQIFQGSFARNNLSFSTLLEEDKLKRVLKMLQKIHGSAIIYVQSRKKTQIISQFLKNNNISADYYHAGLSYLERDYKQNQWMRGSLRVIVATNAFGMGIDKANVRMVIHMSIPESLEAFYQEAGRAGRDGKKAFSTILYTKQDIQSLSDQLERSYPSLEYIKNIYQCLANYYQLALHGENLESYDFDIDQFCDQYKLTKTLTFYGLKILADEGFIILNDSFYKPSQLKFNLSYRDLYDFQLKNPMLEALIKSLLRLYGGDLYNNFTTIIESNLAKELKLKKEDLIKKIQYLSSLGVIEYIPQKDKAQILFLTSRYESQKLPINYPNIIARKKKSLERINKMIDYVTHSFRCRMQIILEYFDEVSYDKCGICDVCLLEKTNLVNQTFEFSDRIITLFKKHNPLRIEEVVSRLAQIPEKTILEHIRRLLDQGIIKYIDDNHLLYIANS
jgi:ATP-dependent DNA helicase RecQ